MVEDAPIGENLGLWALFFRDASHHGGVTFPPERGDRDSGAKLRAGSSPRKRWTLQLSSIMRQKSGAARHNGQRGERINDAGSKRLLATDVFMSSLNQLGQRNVELHGHPTRALVEMCVSEAPAVSFCGGARRRMARTRG